jgi:SepF-like predicted cell division protein (DUF552 family)
MDIERFQLNDQTDLPQIESNLRLGKILFIETNRFFAKYKDDIPTLRQTIERLHAVSNQVGGSIGRVGDDVLVLTPNGWVEI